MVDRRSAIILSVFVTFLLSLVSCASGPPPSKALAEEYYNLGNEWFDLKKYDKAAKAYQTALAWNSELRIASINLARTKAELGDTAAALDLLAPLVAAEPGNLVVLQYQAWLTAKKEGPARAADLYQALAEKLPGDAATQYNAGFSLKAAGRDEEALAALEAWKGLDGKGTGGLTLWAELLEKADSPETADAWLSVAHSLGENDAKRFAPLARRAKALTQRELYGDAVEAWSTALALPSSTDQPRGEALFRKGSLLLLKLEDYQEGSLAVIEAWKAGWKDKEAWAQLRTDPTLPFSVRLEADLKLAGVEP